MSTRRTTHAACLAAAWAAGSATALAGDTIIHVDASAAPGGDGTSWQTAYRHLQDALADNPGSPRQIRVAQGLYRPDRSAQAPGGTGDRTAAFLLADDTEILGGYAGLLGDDPEERDPALFPTVLSGDLAGNDDPDDLSTTDENSYHVIESWSNAPTAVLDGLTVTAGRANRPIAEWDYHERRDDSGAGALLVLSKAVIRACTFRDNQADANASVFIALSGPLAAVEAGSGAILAVRGDPSISDCLFEGNRANRTAGALGLYFSGATVERCDFVGNRVGLPGFGDSSYGAALFDATNTAGMGPRAEYVACRFIANGTGENAATHSWVSQSDFIDCLWLANDGGGMKIDNSLTVRLINCAVIGNAGVGVFECAETFNPVLIHNTIAWANEGGYPNENPNLVSLNFSFGVYDSIVGEIDVEPINVFEAERLYPDDPQLTDETGPDGIPWSGDEDLRPIPGAFANDRGNNAHLALGQLKSGPITEDILGAPRRADDPLAPDTGLGDPPIVDIGPYEFTPCPADFNADGELNILDFVAFQNAFVGQDPAADCDANADFNILDFVCFQGLFQAGCP